MKNNKQTFRFSQNKGNDLARVLCWGSGYTGDQDPLSYLREVIEAEDIRLDRWTVVFHPEEKPEEQILKVPTNTTGKKKKAHQAHLSQQTDQHHQEPAITSSDKSGLLITQNFSLYYYYYISLCIFYYYYYYISFQNTKNNSNVYKSKTKQKILCSFRLYYFQYIFVHIFYKKNLKKYLYMDFDLNSMF